MTQLFSIGTSNRYQSWIPRSTAIQKLRLFKVSVYALKGRVEEWLADELVVHGKPAEKLGWIRATELNTLVGGGEELLQELAASGEDGWGVRRME